MRARLAAAAAGVVLIVTAVSVFALSSRPVTASTNTIEPQIPSIYLESNEHCQRISRVPRGADRLQLLVTYVRGGPRDLHVQVTDRNGLVSAGDLRHPSIGEQRIQLRPRTRQAHPARLCLSNPGRGRIVIGGGPKRLPTSAKGRQVQRRNLASAFFLRPGSASWVSQTGPIADRYGNAQTGPIGGWAIWIAGLLAIAAAALAIWSVVLLPEREA